MVEATPRPLDLPPKIGRHVVLGYLATGGMAEIFLGKEPSGRPVVIKRILPHLARQGNFVSMFIDEARIGSLVHHRNVVEVYELGQVGTDLFMVMEYLAGENTSGLMRRLVSRGERLPLALAAHIVAEACAGLQAAHELHDDSGKPLDLVHRDISPQNIFITYAGEVKVLDFGIATAAHRLTRTATGQVKGKFSYMSPEQCRGEMLDLRSDIFSLGVVLYELTTQRRLFKRPNELMVLKAVTEDVIPRPRREVRDYPPALEAICMKALSRDKSSRQASALELRTDLLAVIAQLDAADLSRSLAIGMESLFTERIVEKRKLMNSVRMGTDLGLVPPAEVDESVEVPQVDEHSASAASQLSAMASPPIEQRRLRWPYILAPLVLVGAGIAVWWFALRDEPAPPAPIVIVSSPAIDAQVATVTPDAASGIALRIDSIPSGATLVVDGETKGPTPHVLRLASKHQLRLTLELAGYAPVTQELAVDHDQDLLIPLVAAPEPPKPPDKPPVKRGAKDPKPPVKDPFKRYD